MKTRISMTVVAILLLSNAVASADSVYFHGGDPPKASGKITDMSPTEVSLSGKAPFSADAIHYIRFEGEPKALTIGRKYALSGRYAKAMGALKKVKGASIENPSAKADHAFYEGYCYAHYAFGAAASKREQLLKSAERRLSAFVGSGGKNNYHLFEARELLGDVALAKAKLKKDAAEFGKARKHYSAVSKAAPWPAAKLRMDMKTAQAFQAEGKANEAASLFEQIAKSNLEGPEVDAYKGQATLGMANAMAEGGRAGEAIAMVNKVILATDPKQHDVLAQAYLVMGRCARVGGKSKEELIAYLHIDLLYHQDTEIHEEALGRLAKLWSAADQQKRASEAELKLRSINPQSKWLKR